MKGGQAGHPLTAADAPVALEVRYDGRPVPLEVREGKAFVPFLRTVLAPALAGGRADERAVSP